MGGRKLAISPECCILLHLVAFAVNAFKARTYSDLPGYGWSIETPFHVQTVSYLTLSELSIFFSSAKFGWAKQLGAP